MMVPNRTRFLTSYFAYKADKWEEIYGINKQKPQKESVHERLQNYQRENAERQTEKTSKRKDRGTK